MATGATSTTATRRQNDVRAGSSGEDRLFLFLPGHAGLVLWIITRPRDRSVTALLLPNVLDLLQREDPPTPLNCLRYSKPKPHDIASIDLHRTKRRLFEIGALEFSEGVERLMNEGRLDPIPFWSTCVATGDDVADQQWQARTTLRSVW